MKISKTDNVQFQKKLVAEARVKKNDNSEKVYIYKLDDNTDRKYFQKPLDDDSWQGTYYLDVIRENFLTLPKYPVLPHSYYVMEDKKGKLLGATDVAETEKAIHVYYIETAPKYSLNNSDKRAIKYVGETMLAFFATLCKSTVKIIKIHDITSRQAERDFYFKNCGFKDTDYNDAEMSDFDEFLSHNSNHTGSAVKLINKNQTLLKLLSRIQRLF